MRWRTRRRPKMAPPERQALAQGTELLPGAASAQVSRHHIYSLTTLRSCDFRERRFTGCIQPVSPRNFLHLGLWTEQRSSHSWPTRFHQVDVTVTSSGPLCAEHRQQMMARDVLTLDL